jgi:glutamate-ammonia-ligase adenylyltransferase
MLKARPIAGDVAYGREFLQRIATVIFDNAASARRQVRDLKGRIERQLRSRGHAAGHVKLGPGGIRDVEFIAQAVQLEAGGMRPELRTGNTLAALARAHEAGIVASQDVEQLRDAYVFLRVVEHRLQLMENQQVHHLPKTDRELRVLARSLGFRGADEVQAFRERYDRHVTGVRAIFERVLPAGGIKSEIR